MQVTRFASRFTFETRPASLSPEKSRDLANEVAAQITQLGVSATVVQENDQFIVKTPDENPNQLAEAVGIMNALKSKGLAYCKQTTALSEGKIRFIIETDKTSRS